jgi:hypothetical protein
LQALQTLPTAYGFTAPQLQGEAGETDAHPPQELQAIENPSFHHNIL